MRGCATHGYAAGTTNRIAERARVSIGSLYQYFPNKDAVLAALLVRHIDRGTWTEADQLELSAGNLEATVRALVRNAIDNHSDDPQLLRIMIGTWSPASCAATGSGAADTAPRRGAGWPGGGQGASADRTRPLPSGWISHSEPVSIR